VAALRRQRVVQEADDAAGDQAAREAGARRLHARARALGREGPAQEGAGGDHAHGGARRVGALGRGEREARVRAGVDGAGDDPGAEAEQGRHDRLARAAREEADRQGGQRPHDPEEDRLLEHEVADGEQVVAVQRRAVDEIAGDEVGGEGGEQSHRRGREHRAGRVVGRLGLRRRRGRRHRRGRLHQRGRRRGPGGADVDRARAAQ
jgi:hypothetical protein